MRARFRQIIVPGLLAATNSTAMAGEPGFKRIPIDPDSRSEACALADVTGDGLLDVLSGNYYYRAPDWTPQKFADLPTISEYLNVFGNFGWDMDADGDLDVINAGWHTRKTSWFENPGRGIGAWREHLLDQGHPVECLHLVDLDGDGSTDDLLPNFGGSREVHWFELGAGAEWGTRVRRHFISNTGNGHGIGAGDVNGDGRPDVLTPNGWLEAPRNPRAGRWFFHPDWSLNRPSEILAYDVDQDGDTDFLFGHGHDYGVVWMEQQVADGQRRFAQHVIDDSWSQAHNIVLADMDGDHDLDIVTGKRMFGHNGRDPGAYETPGIYWYELQRRRGGVVYVRHIIDAGTNGAGHQIGIHDYDDDGDLDVFVGGKKGVYLYQNLMR